MVKIGVGHIYGSSRKIKTGPTFWTTLYILVQYSTTQCMNYTLKTRWKAVIHMSVKPFSGKHISFLGVNCLWPIWYKLGPMWSVADIVLVPIVPIECVRYFAVRW